MSPTALCSAGKWKSLNPDPRILLVAWKTLWIYAIQLQKIEDSERHVEGAVRRTVGKRSWGLGMGLKT